MRVVALIIFLLLNAGLFLQDVEVSVMHIKLSQILSDFNVNRPFGVEVDSKGNLYILDQQSHRISVINKNLEYLFSFPEVGLEAGALYYPQDFVIRGDECYILHNKKITVFRTDGTFLREISIKSVRTALTNIAINPAGEIFVQSFENNSIINVYSKEGELIRSFGKYLEAFDELTFAEQIFMNMASFCFDNEDNLFVAFRYYPVIRKYDRNGKLLFEKMVRGEEIGKLDSFKPELKPIPTLECKSVCGKVAFTDIKIDPRDNKPIVQLVCNAYKLNENVELMRIYHFKANGDLERPIIKFTIMKNGKALFCGRFEEIYACQF